MNEIEYIPLSKDNRPFDDVEGPAERVQYKREAFAFLAMLAAVVLFAVLLVVVHII